MKRNGIVKAVSKKKEGRTAFTLTDAKNSDGTDIWFNGGGFVAEKGDAIEFDVEVNGIWHNFSNVQIVAKGSAAPQTSYPGQPVTQPQVAQPQLNVPIATNQPVNETGIAFIELYGKKYKITLEADG